MSPPRALLAALLLCQLLSYGGHQGLTKIFYTLPDTGQPPILISLAENAKLDLRTPEELLFANESEQHNETTSFAIADSAGDDDEEKEVTEKASTEPRLVVKAKPIQDRQPEEAPQSIPAPPDAELVDESQPVETLEENIPIKPETPQEDIPSFSEWAQKQLAEAEKKDTVLNHSSQPSHSNTNFSSKNTKLRSKNYASPACGAKVVAVNPEAGSASSILSPNRDEYMLNTCNSRIWFVVELCEAVQAQKIEIANFELFSSTPKDIAVGFSDRFPVREWASVGQFTAQDMRDVQSFDLYPQIFGKFIRVELLSHHGSEHYCPISLFKVYGTSEFEVLEKESSQHSAHIDEDEEDEIIDVPDVPAAEAEPSKNLFGSARDAVMSIMKKAAQALVKSEVPNNVSSEHNDTSTDNMYKKCCSPSHIIVCDNCSETLYNDVYELLSCSSDRLSSLVRQVFLRDTLKCTSVCQNYGLDFKSTKTIEFGDERAAYVNSFFPPKYIAALCNILAIKEKKVVLNTSFETEMNVTSNVTVDESPQKLNSETNSEQELKLVPIKDNDTDDKINETAQSDDKTVPEQKLEHAPIELPKDDKDNKDSKEDSQTIIEEQQPLPEPQVDSGPQEKQIEEKSEIENQDSPKVEIKNGKDVNMDKPKDNLNIGDEISDQVMIESDGFISELDQMAVDPTPAGAQAALNQNQAQATLQKESVFLRLSNRVKTLERNMSLSGQYLEELSRRYKKQVEEMQKSFEKTILQMSEERKKSNEREQKYLDQMNLLQDKLAQMTLTLEMLMEESDSWFGNLTFFKFFIYQSIILVIAFYYISKKKKPESILVPIPKKTKKKPDKFRRKSVEGVSGHATPSAKKRRPSEEAFQIVRHSDEIEPDAGEWQVARKNRRRKPSMIVHRDAGSEVKDTSNECVRELQENPIPLDEAEFFAPVSEPKEFTDNKVKELPKTNGSFFNNLKTKTMKTRRLSSPAFLRTFNRQSSRSTPSPVVRTLEPIFNGKLSKKAASESPTGSLWSESTDISQNGHPDSESGGKKKKSFKNILKKVF
ncbi:SUN domain-containing ossification factor isoform X2 [Bicyclus anynana]|uniref:SUN domain-containing ossification factor isoform X2 n=1 Tax=Bicyclus anynana TaxID=110368 RepID=A0A6J1N7E7_BICAN|nr:SUN domain-containing ossification factor isoform X2 [Bicyclus anynana]XP_023941043.1 SUN domain-containing ossification factor isoform X2 [Bicyclus anynana]XP_052747270.1 SUN domain-containing ossification factor isoform X2 [Bicyclus anynana]XP_052747271.1 SUN domain-containing ossification factor isoform X2 [Bicyclus anynana]XP_052747272.1 SUN domain-containing ossification factor isoform X2 [Bicyclus anynana]XP_052747273.1 SUN domain-containing ossification factor isoform X2 [Bicyclus an